jgi:regulator of cell morphogenesis and NO signaling
VNRKTDEEVLMVEIDTTTTLATLVDAHPHLARELERRQLDYCCGGGQTLAEACSRAGLDADVVAAELALVPHDDAPAEWTTMDAAELVDHLESTHHRYLWDEMPRIGALVDKIVDVHGERHPELFGIRDCWVEFRTDMEPHLLKEERVLFPMVRDLVAATDAPTFHCGTLRNPISVMLREHDVVGDLMARMRMLTDGYTAPADGCATYTATFAALAEIEADTHLHIHLENNVLFPMVVRLEAEKAVSPAGSR